MIGKRVAVLSGRSRKPYKGVCLQQGYHEDFDSAGDRTGTSLYGNQAVSLQEILGFADRPRDRGALNAGC